MNRRASGWPRTPAISCINQYPRPACLRFAAPRVSGSKILVLGKALGGGVLPIAAVLARADLDVGGHWAFGHYTHEKNPVTCRAALTTLEIIEDEGLVENARRRGRAISRSGAGTEFQNQPGQRADPDPAADNYRRRDRRGAGYS